jgi:esterase/lipase superfamily enzyme
MDDTHALIATVRLAADIYRELGVAPDHPNLLLADVLAPEREEWAVRIQDVAGLGKKDVKGVDSPLYAQLKDWRDGVAPSELIRVLELGILRLADAIYDGNYSTELKEAVEPAAFGSAQTLAILGQTDVNETRGFAIYPDGLVESQPVAERDLSEDEVDGYPVWFATNREPVDAARPELGYTYNRSKSGVYHGRCVVHVPKSHKIGSLGSNVLMRVLRRADDRLTIQKIEVFDDAPFWTGINEALGRTEAKDRHAVVFIHGYHVSFEGAALRAAQIGYDLGISGAMTFFSWPSKGSLRGYFADGNSVMASAPAITDFLVEIAKLPNVEHVHVIAHSMGNRGALSAVSRIAAEAERLSGRRFEQFVLAAADVDAQEFGNDAEAYVQLGERTTLYVSPSDKALAASQFVNAFARAGYQPPINTFSGIDTVDVGAIDLDQLGHGYVGNSRGVLADIHELIFKNTAADGRFGVEKRQTSSGGTYYAFKE